MNEVAVGVESEARADHEIPPAGAAILVFAGDVGIAAERVEDEDGVGFVGVEGAPGLVGDGVGRKGLSAVEGQGRVDGVGRGFSGRSKRPEDTSCSGI